MRRRCAVPPPAVRTVSSSSGSKRCSKCTESLALDKFYMTKTKTRPRSVCIACYSKHYTAPRQARRVLARQQQQQQQQQQQLVPAEPEPEPEPEESTEERLAQLDDAVLRDLISSATAELVSRLVVIT